MRFARSLVEAVTLLAWSLGAFASPAPAYSENFDSLSFRSSVLLLNDTSDNWSHTDYYHLNNFDGWTFTGGGTYYATNGAGNGAILLNEDGSATASRTVTGLTAGASYTLQFNVWGDNKPAKLYGLNVSINGNPVLAMSGVADQVAGYYSGSGGTLQSIAFTPTGTSALLSFAQNTPPGSPASPIIDNVRVMAAVPEPETYAMLLAGLSLMGFVAYRRK